MSEEEKSNLYVYVYSDYEEDFIFKELKYTLADLHKLQQENQQLKEEFDRMFAIYHSRKLIKKFNDEYDEEDKTKNPNRDYACVCPDAEEVYKRYYKLKEQLKQKEDIINKAKEYIINNSLYEEEYDYDYEENIYLSGIHDDDVSRILLEILDN